jgi:hypothetical protein
MHAHRDRHAAGGETPPGQPARTPALRFADGAFVEDRFGSAETRVSRMERWRPAGRVAVAQERAVAALHWMSGALVVGR